MYLLVKFDLFLKKYLVGGFDVFHSLLMECVHLNLVQNIFLWGKNCYWPPQPTMSSWQRHPAFWHQQHLLCFLHQPLSSSPELPDQEKYHQQLLSHTNVVLTSVFEYHKFEKYIRSVCARLVANQPASLCNRASCRQGAPNPTGAAPRTDGRFPRSILLFNRVYWYSCVIKDGVVILYRFCC